MENKDIDKARKVSSEVLQSLPTHLYDEVKSCINELIEALEEFHKTWESIADVFPSLNNQPCYTKATQLLEKYGKKAESVKPKEQTDEIHYTNIYAPLHRERRRGMKSWIDS